MKKETVPSVAVVFCPEGASYQQVIRRVLVDAVERKLEGKYESESWVVSSPVKR